MGAYVEIGGIQYPVQFDPPGELANILQIPEADSPVFMKFYGVIEGDAQPDRQISYADLVKFLYSASNIRVGEADLIEGVNTIIFKVGGTNTPFTTTGYAIVYTKGYELGLYDEAKQVDSFKISAMNPGKINYIAILFT